MAKKASEEDKQKLATLLDTNRSLQEEKAQLENEAKKPKTKSIKVARIDPKTVDQKTGMVKPGTNGVISQTTKAVRVNGQWVLPSKDGKKPDMSVVDHDDRWRERVSTPDGKNFEYKKPGDGVVYGGMKKAASVATSVMSAGQSASAKAVGGAVDKVTAIKNIVTSDGSVRDKIAGAAGVGITLNKQSVINDSAKGAINAARGKEVSSYTGILDKAGVKNPIVKGVVGTGLDVFLDPTTYAGGIGLSGKLSKAEQAKVIAEHLAGATAKHEASAVVTKTVKKISERVVDNVPDVAKAAESKARKEAAAKLAKDRAERLIEKARVPETKLKSGRIVTRKEVETEAAKQGVPVEKVVLRDKGKIVSSPVTRQAASRPILKQADEATKSAELAASRVNALETTPTKLVEKLRTIEKEVPVVNYSLSYDDALKLAEIEGKKAAEALKPGRLTFRVGNKMVPIEGKTSEAVYNTGARASKWFKDTSVGQWGQKTFNTDVVMTNGKLVTDSGVNKISRKIKAASLNEQVAKMENIDSIFKGLSSQEQKTISHAIQQGKTAQLAAMNSSIEGKSLKYFADEAQKINRQLFDEEVAAGLRVEEDFNPNYLYQHYNTGTESAIKDFKAARTISEKRLRKSSYPASDMAAHNAQFGVDAAKKLGLTPTEEIGNILRQRSALSTSKIIDTKIKRELVERFGVVVDRKAEAAALKNGLVDVGDGSRRFIHEDIKNAIDQIDEIRKNPKHAEELFGRLSQIQDLWKFQATAVRPGHHINNAMGDIFINMLDGVVDPKVYKLSKAAVQGKGRGLEVRMARGIKADVEDMFRNYVLSGGKSGRSVIENTEARLQESKVGNFMRSKGVKKIQNFSDKREDWTRFAHFMDATKKEVADGATLEEAYQKAADRVIHFNHDYGDLTETEKNLRKNYIPFYTWVRKNTPLMIESAFARPGLMVIPEKFQSGVEKSLGGGKEEFTNVRPDYYKFMASISSDPQDMSEILFSHKMPSQDFRDLVDNPANSSLNLAKSASPFVKALFELPYGKKLAGGKTGSTADYATDQVGLLKLAKDSVDPNISSTDKKLAFLRLMTGMNVFENNAKSKGGVLAKENTELRKKIQALYDEADKRKYGK